MLAMVLPVRVAVVLDDVFTKMPRNPTVVPVPWIAMEPRLLFELFVIRLRKVKMPTTGAVPVVVDDSLITIVEEPSRLPIVLPVVLPTLNSPSVEPSMIPMKEAEVEVLLVLDVV